MEAREPTREEKQVKKKKKFFTDLIHGYRKNIRRISLLQLLPQDTTMICPRSGIVIRTHMRSQKTPGGTKGLEGRTNVDRA